MFIALQGAFLERKIQKILQVAASNSLEMAMLL